MKRRPIQWYNVALNALAALVWTANCAVLAAYTRQDPPAVLLGLDVLCAVIWWAAFAAALIRWRRGRRDRAE